MASFIFGVMLGRFAHFAGLPASDDALIAVPIEAAGVESDATLRDKDTLADVLSGATNEQATMGRKTLASVTVTIDDANDRVDVDCADLVWSAATGNAISDLAICYDPDTTGGTDGDIIPVSWHDLSVTPDGSDLTVTVATFARATG